MPKLPPRMPSSSATKNALLATDIPGAFRNRAGILCNEHGIALGFAKLKALDDSRWMETLGSVPRTPAELLKGVALDPRMHIDVRLAAARHAAPYFDCRMPMKLEVEGHATAGTLDLAKLAGMKRQERELLLKLLKQAGAEV